MIPETSPQPPAPDRAIAETLLNQGQYAAAASLLEQAIEANPDDRAAYWFLGLALLLQGQEMEAQTVWMMGLAEGEAEQIDDWMRSLQAILVAEAQHQETQQQLQQAWLIRQHLREIQPLDLENVLHLVRLACDLEEFVWDYWQDWAIETVLQEAETDSSQELLLEVLARLLHQVPQPEMAQAFAALVPRLQDPSGAANLLIQPIMRIAYTKRLPALAAMILEAFLSADERNLMLWQLLASCYHDTMDYSRAIQSSRRALEQSPTLADKALSCRALLRSVLGAGGYWDEAQVVFQEYSTWLNQLVETAPLDLDNDHVLGLIPTTFFLPYFKDDPRQTRGLHDRVMALCLANIRRIFAEPCDRYANRHQQRQQTPQKREKLRVGYISNYFCQHSVGWLARWLIKHHDADRVEVYLYFVNYKQADDFLQDQYESYATVSRHLGTDTVTIAEQIFQDDLDILVDLDSITVDITCEVMALRPAPIQVTWLGWDAAGLETIDYFIADPYVLPESAQDYYTEKIWRLPESYIAVDGFEVSVPTLRRSDLGISEDAIVFLTGQRGYKRHRDTALLQLQIIRNVPNSYLLIKGFADDESIQKFFYELADEVGVDRDRLRFLPNAPSEAVHRANLRIADVVLDTYPYNGATTTLETLWMEVPIVTWVGEQFAARNSYTMMVNVGITAGIAWSDAEYVEWGTRLGTDAQLRNEVILQLRRSKQTAPLWNGLAFAQNMEAGYRAMCDKYYHALSQ